MKAGLVLPGGPILLKFNFNKDRLKAIMESKNQPKTLSSLRKGESGVIESVETSKETAIKLLEMGIGPGEEIKFIRTAPFGDPIEFELMNYRIALRRSEAEKILLKQTIH